MRSYETIFICRQDISAQQVDTLADSFESIITDAGGKMGRRENWGLKTLAYRIKRNRKGHIVLFNYDAAYETVKEMERRMRLSENVIRYMTIRTAELETKDSIGIKDTDIKSA